MSGAVGNQDRDISAVNTITKWDHLSLKVRIEQAFNQFDINPSTLNLEMDADSNARPSLQERYSYIFTQDILSTEKFDLLKEALSPRTD